MQENVERWLVHEGLSYEYTKNHPENTFHVLVKHAGTFGVPIEIFEPNSQPGILVVGANIVMKNNQTARYLGFNDEEKSRFEKKVGYFCYSIKAIHKMIAEDGKQKVGVFVVLDDKTNINQYTLLDAIDRVSEMHEKTSRFLMKTF